MAMTFAQHEKYFNKRVLNNLKFQFIQLERLEPPQTLRSLELKRSMSINWHFAHGIGIQNDDLCYLKLLYLN
jgi:hypothetical protein